MKSAAKPEFNYLQNPGFEDGALGAWVATDLKNAEQLYVEDKANDSLGGSWHMHFWSPQKDSVEFTLEQPVSGLRSGNYDYEISIMGGDCGDTDIYAYVKIDGEIVGKAPMGISGYGNWAAGRVEGIAYTEGQTIVVGIYVKCSGEGNGAWGKIDGAMLNSAG